MTAGRLSPQAVTGEWSASFFLFFVFGHAFCYFYAIHKAIEKHWCVTDWIDYLVVALRLARRAVQYENTIQYIYFRLYS